jgi:hypothetical protein
MIVRMGGLPEDLGSMLTPASNRLSGSLTGSQNLSQRALSGVHFTAVLVGNPQVDRNDATRDQVLLG